MVLLMSHVAIFSNFGGTVLVIIRLGPSVGYGGLNHHDVDNSGGLDIGTSIKRDDFPKYLKSQVHSPFLLSVVMCC